jgi:Tfp pilus assembly protein PilO
VIDRMSGRVSLLLVSAALIVVLLLGWFVLVSPESSKASKLSSEVDETNVQLQAVTSLLEGPIGRQSLALLRVSQTAVPDDAKMSQILRQLSAAASIAGVELDSIAPQPVVPSNGAEALPITMSVKGRYFAIQKFLRNLRSKAGLRGDKIVASGRLYTVDSIQFSGQAPGTDQSASSGVVQASLAVNAFVYAPTAVTATTPAATSDTGVTPTAP